MYVRVCACERVIFTPSSAYRWYLRPSLALRRGLFSRPHPAAGCWEQGDDGEERAQHGGWGQVDPRGPGKLRGGGSGAPAPGSVPCGGLGNRRVLSLASGVSAVAPSSILRITRANAATWWRIGDTAGSRAAGAPGPCAGGLESRHLLSRRPGGGGGKAGRLTSRHPLPQAVRPAALPQTTERPRSARPPRSPATVNLRAVGALLPRSSLTGEGATLGEPETPPGARGRTPRAQAGHLAGGRASPGASATSCPAPARTAVPGPSVPVASVSHHSEDSCG